MFKAVYLLLNSNRQDVSISRISHSIRWFISVETLSSDWGHLSSHLCGVARTVGSSDNLTCLFVFLRPPCDLWALFAPDPSSDDEQQWVETHGHFITLHTASPCTLFHNTIFFTCVNHVNCLIIFDLSYKSSLYNTLDRVFSYILQLPCLLWWWLLLLNQLIDCCSDVITSKHVQLFSRVSFQAVKPGL